MKQSGLVELLGIDHPVVLAPFGGLSSVDLTALVSRCGGLGSYGLYGYSPERIGEEIAQLRSATEAPFAVNLWLATGSEIWPGSEALSASREVLAEFFAEMDMTPAEERESFLPGFDE